MSSKPAARELEPATISEHAGVRYLHLGTPWVQGAMRIRKPEALELEYVQRMMVWMLFRPAAELTSGHAVQLGLGAGAITRFCHQVLKMRTTAVELNPTVIDACRLWFRLPAESARFTLLEMDAAAFAGDPERAGSADVLCVDLYDHEAASPVLDSVAFYRDCRRLLADGGVMTVDLFGRDASFDVSVGRIVAAFGRDAVRTLSPTREGNQVVVAMKQVTAPDRALLAERAQNIETRFKLPARKWLRMIQLLPEPEPGAAGPSGATPPPA
ncbi:methyltransferase domain-containing protein [Piscinibacter koreensis]|uniref:Methyltransferase domain-containing protein n=1 Tax=Piscinibacter koreensis TaxID=2742824 RepID=A0A7Y6TXM1_9BURK|nr:methyltransferase domain-containing protein [Schlegelella koreensis]NUZ07205.1 methyltransferase domain-containing protein [Schlegelella koreensis]